MYDDYWFNQRYEDARWEREKAQEDAWAEAIGRDLKVPVYFCVYSWTRAPSTYIYWDDVAKEWYI